MKKKTIYFELLLLFCLSLLPLFWLKPGEVVMGHDSGFRINFLYYYKSLLYAWNPVFNFGVDWQLYKGFLLTQLPEFIGTVLTGSWVIGQRIMMVFWFFVMQASMYILVKALKPEKKQWVFRLSASIFYAFNFFILQAWFIVERAKFSLYAALPLSILLFYQVFEKKKPVAVYAVLFGFLYLFASGGGSAPLYGATLVVWAICIAYFSLIHWKENKLRGILFGLQVACLFGAAFLFINAYWIVPQIGLYLSTYKTAVAERGGIDGLIAWERVNSQNASIVNLLRLQGVPDWYDNPNNPFSSTFLHTTILILASFIPIFTIGIGFIVSFYKKIRHNSVIYLACILLAVGLLLGGGSHPPFGILFEYAMRHVPGFAIFRSSFYKFGPLIWFSIIFLFAYFIDFAVGLIKKKGTAFILGVCIIGGILVYHYPFFTANIFQFDKFFSTKVSVPSYVETMAEYANTHTDVNTRIMVLPELTPSFYNVQMDSYSWKFFSLDILPRNTIDRSIVANDNNAPDAVFRMYTEFMDGNKDAFTRLARYAGIRYILWRSDAIYSKSVIDGRTISFQKDKLDGFHFKKIFQAGEWELYDLGESTPIPLVWTPHQIAVTRQPLADPLDYLLMSNSSSSAVIEGTELPENVVAATCVYCELGVFDKMVKETPQPTLRFQPGSPLFPRLLTADANAIKAAGSDPEAIFNAYISHSQLQLAILASPKKPAGFNESAIVADIERSFTIAQEQVGHLSGRQRNVYATRLLLYSDVSARFIKQNSTLESFFETLREQVKPLVWITENNNDIRYEFEISKDNTYSAIITNVDRLPGLIEIDGVAYANYQAIHLVSGYHTARIVSPATTRGFAPLLFFSTSEFTPVITPTIKFTKINPTKYSVQVVNSTGPYVLILNEAFDARWKVTVSGDSQAIAEKNHGKVNGFANGWVMTKMGNYTVYIDYQPQQYFIVGALISIVGIGVGSFLVWRKRS